MGNIKSNAEVNRGLIKLHTGEVEKMPLFMYMSLCVCVFFIAGGFCEVSAVRYAVTPSNQTVLLHDNVTVDCCLLGMEGHTFVWQAFYGVPSQLIFERGPNNTSAVETPSKFSVRCSSGQAGSLCCNLTIHNVMAQDLGQPITCYGYRFDPSEPGQGRSPSVYLTNGADVTSGPGLSAKMIGLVVAAALCAVAIVAVAVYKLRKGCSAADTQPVVLEVMDDLDTEETDML
ncbi:uncharacterized protein LOC144920353 isoform X1 [Branchiostoma floridae x Branchiostoma belcheri]